MRVGAWGAGGGGNSQQATLNNCNMVNLIVLGTLDTVIKLNLCFLANPII